MKNFEEGFANGQEEEKSYSKNGFIALIQKLWNARFVRFLFVGALNTLFSYLLYAFLVFIGINYVWARVISIILGIIFNFFTTGRIVFNNKDNWLIIRFILVYAVTMSLDVFVLKRLVENMTINKYLAGALTTIPIALLSFLLNSVFTFKTIKLCKKPPKDT
ncbi:MAG TPA: GtrA family protein [Anaerolineaceae bacterium]|nr:GtrA family protein [Anaerolineaceae bacterium]HQC63601.1 GtrA family protein [Anaerolineaceae bacterium]